MGLRDDLERFKAVGEDHRMDLQDFIEHGQMGEDIKIPIKVVDLPEFVYDDVQQGGIGQAEDGDPEQGDPVDQGDPQGDPEEGEPGEEEGEHGYYEMDPEEFAEELDDELDLDLDPKGKEVVEETIGDMVEVAQTGPRSALDLDYLYKEGLKRKMATWYDEDFLVEACKVMTFTSGRDVFDYVRSTHSMPVDVATVRDVYEKTKPTSDQSVTVYPSTDELEEKTGGPKRAPPAQDIDEVPIRSEDERYRHPEIIEEKQKNVVVVNIRDVSGSMHAEKRELVERVFTPLDWYLQGKYENAEFRYIAHDASAWEVDRVDFFGIESGGGTQISTAYKLAKELLDTHYPWSDWNRYVFGAGDGENWSTDTTDNLVPLIEETDANLHAYVETQSGTYGNVAETLESELGSDIVTASVDSTDDVIPAIEKILREASVKSQED